MTTDELRALLQKASVLLEAAATVGISAQYENGNDTPNKRYCRETVNEIYAALSSDFAVVPLNPTKEMATAACDISDGYENLLGCNVIEIYQAMIKVAEKK